MISQHIAASIRARKISRALLIAAVFLSSPQAAQTGQSNNPQGAHEAPPLRYRLIVTKASVCRHESINLELELENISDHRVTIDRRALLHTISISRTGGGIIPTGDLVGKSAKENLITLEAGKSYRQDLPYPLQGSFFSVTGLYSIQVTYGQFKEAPPEFPELYTGVVESNTVLFEIKDC